MKLFGNSKGDSGGQNGKSLLLYGTAAVVGGAVAVFGAPFVVSGLGFKAAGIAAGTWGAYMMSASAIANGGGVAAGGVVATLQSVGAAGFGAVGTALSGVLGAAAGFKGATLLKKKD